MAESKQLSPVKKAIASMGDSSNKSYLKRFGFFHCILEGEKASDAAVKERLIIRAEKLEKSAAKKEKSAYGKHVPDAEMQIAILEQSRQLYAAAAECRIHVASLSTGKQAAEQRSAAAEDFGKAAKFGEAGWQGELAAMEYKALEDHVSAISEYGKASKNYTKASMAAEAKHCDDEGGRLQLLLEQKEAERQKILAHQEELETAKKLEREKIAAKQKDLERADFLVGTARMSVDEAGFLFKVNEIIAGAVTGMTTKEAAHIQKTIESYTNAIARYEKAVGIYSKYSEGDFGVQAKKETVSKTLEVCKALLERLEKLKEIAQKDGSRGQTNA